ncbi:hypothetical protein EVAR_3059_1 [Eumeta japonica]|uniref:Uncharacterized protein n=1 Tax=Eumeta variegata TaxID=151549 RepID=A0A4C1SW91_EUMVA|nr:hypothetical protein EVAR_3059_1 [Eumeta japonica]
MSHRTRERPAECLASLSLNYDRKTSSASAVKVVVSGSQLTGILGRESEALGEWAGGAVSLARRHPALQAVRTCACATAVRRSEPPRLLVPATFRVPASTGYAACNSLPGHQQQRGGRHKRTADDARMRVPRADLRRLSLPPSLPANAP